MAFEKYNQIGKNPKQVQALLERIVKQDNAQKLRQGLEKVMDMFADGDKWAIDYVTDRLDGKATQTTNVNINQTLTELTIEQLQTIASGARDTEPPTIEGEFNEVH